MIVRGKPVCLGYYIAIESEDLYIELAKNNIHPLYMDNVKYYYEASKDVEEIINAIKRSKILD